MDELDRLRTPVGYMPSPAKPEGFDEALTRIGGLTPAGTPFLQIGWGWDLRGFRNGRKDALKYPGPFLSRWILEKWMAPEVFGSAWDWEKSRYLQRADGSRLDSLGPYPRQGLYGMVMPLIAGGLHGTSIGEYLPCGDAVLEFVQINLPQFYANTPKCYSTLDSLLALQEQMEEQERLSGETNPELREVRKEVQKAIDAESGEDWEKAEEQGRILSDEIKVREDHINRNPEFSFSNNLVGSRSLWTPQGEIPIQ